jgi:hypothetical protein
MWKPAAGMVVDHGDQRSSIFSWRNHQKLIEALNRAVSGAP